MAQTPCIFRQWGDYIDHTPAAAVAAGEVVVLNSVQVCIAPLAIAANKMGSLAVMGGWNVPKDSTVWVKGDHVYWDADGSPVGGTALSGAFSNNPDVGPRAGFALEGAAADVGDADIKLQAGIEGGALASLYGGNDTAVVGGTAIANANTVAYGFNLVTGADNTAAVRLPAAAAGRIVIIKNAVTTAILKVFPTANDKINNAAANAVYNQANGALRHFYANDAINWWTDEEVPT